MSRTARSLGISIQKTGGTVFPASQEKYTRWDAASPGDDHHETLTLQERRGIGGTTKNNVNIEPTKNNQEKNVRWAKDYEL